MKERYMAEPIKKTTARNHELERWSDNRQTVDDTAKGTYSDFGRHKLKTVSNLRKNLQNVSIDLAAIRKLYSGSHIRRREGLTSLLPLTFL